MGPCPPAADQAAAGTPTLSACPPGVPTRGAIVEMRRRCASVWRTAPVHTYIHTYIQIYINIVEMLGSI